MNADERRSKEVDSAFSCVHRRFHVTGASRFTWLVLLPALLIGLGSLSGPMGGSPAQAAASGRILFGHGGEIWMAERGETYRVTQGGRYWGQPDWSPDGTSIAAVGWSQNASDLFLLDAEGSEVRQLTRSQGRQIHDSAWVFLPRWSPDGQLIAYLSDRTTQYPALWTMRPDGTGARQRISLHRGLDAIDSFTWSPDGTRIAATGFAGAVSQVHIIDLGRPATSRVISSEPGGAFDPAWSPDGVYVAYAARDGRTTVIRVVDAEAQSSPITLVQSESARGPRWSPSGTALAYIALAGPQFEVFAVDITVDREGRLAAARPTQITRRMGVDATSGLSWAP